jgi:hypothetical protein
MLGASAYVPYEAGPESYSQLRTGDSSIMEELKNNLDSEMELPAYYLTPEYQEIAYSEISSK